MKEEDLPKKCRASLVVLHFAETIRGGVGTVMGQLLASQSADLRVIAAHVLAPRHGAELLGSGASQVNHLFNGRKRGVLGILSLAVTFLMLVLKVKPDVVHLHSSFAGLVGRLGLFALRPWTRPRVVYCPHAFAFLMNVSPFKKRVYACIERLLAQVTDVIICVSVSERSEAIKQGLSGSKLKVIYNGVEVTNIVDRSPTRDRVELLFVGRLDFQKGYDVLVQAIHALDADRFHLTVVGEAVVADFVPVSLPQISYVGWKSQSELDAFYRACDVLVMPSRWEGFAMVPLEAASRGAGLLCTDLDSTRELITDGVNGRLFECGDAQALTSILSSTSRDEWHRMGVLLRERVSTLFSLQEMEEKTFACYWSHDKGASL